MRIAGISLVVVAGLIAVVTATVIHPKNATTAPPPSTTFSEDAHAVAADVAAITDVETTLSTSSNPFDYANHSPAVERLVSRGTSALAPIEATLRASSNDGLSEYLLMIAAQRIAKVDVYAGPTDSPLRGVSTAKQWPDAWSTYRRAIPGYARAILASRATVAEKNRALAALGTPALPIIIDQVAAGHDEFTPSADLLLRGSVEVSGSPNVHVTPEWARANAGRFEALRQLTQ